MGALTSNADMDDVFATWLNKTFITDLEFQLQHQKFTAAVVMPDAAGGNIARFNEWAPPTRSTSYASGSTALTEATTTQHEITSITTTPTNVTIAEYGEWLRVGKLWEHAAITGSREKISKRVSDGGAVSIDSVVRTAATTTTNVFYALGLGNQSVNYVLGGSATAPATVGTFGVAALMSGRKILFDALVTGIEGVAGHTDGNYAAVLTPKQILDMTTEVTTQRIVWSNCVVNVPGMDGQRRFVKGIVGDCYKVGVYETQNYATTSLTSTCDIGFMYGADGVAAASFEQMQPQIILNDVNSPYKNVNSVAWHAYFGAGLTNNVRVLKLYSLS